MKGYDDNGDLVIFFVMEYIESDLADLIALGPESGLTEDHLTLLVYNLLCAMKFLHSANVLHRDIKPSNILVNANCDVKICDYGISRTIPECHLGKGAGNSKRMRDSILQKGL
jgi:mitogen-activated protein kinase 1/3